MPKDRYGGRYTEEELELDRKGRAWAKKELKREIARQKRKQRNEKQVQEESAQEGAAPDKVPLEGDG